MKTFLVIAALVVAGCGKKKQEEAPATAGNTPTAGSAMAGSAPMPPPTAGSGSAADIPTEQDFEAQAKTKITDKNVESQLSAIEKDLGQ